MTERTSAQEHAHARPLWQGALHVLGAPVAEELKTWAMVGELMLEALRRLPRTSSWRRTEIIQAISQIGVGSLPIIGICTGFAGLVITSEIAWHMDKALHTVSMIPGFTAQFIFRELGVAIPACLLVAKAGAATTAELGSMKVTEQIDALKLLGIDPVDYLVMPRFIAGIISCACLTWVAIAVTLSCALLVAVVSYNFSVLEYLNALRHFVGYKDALAAVIKGTVYGALIPIIACAYGFRCQGGAEGVGTATTNSVVAGTIAVIVSDFVLTYLFTWFLA